MTKIVLLAVALSCSGCACNLNWQRYHPVQGTTAADPAMIQEDFYIQVTGTDHSRRSGLTSDIREPYDIHTILSTRTDVTAYEISRIRLILGSGTEEILGTEDDPVRVPCTENENGLFIGRYTFGEAFDEIEPALEIRIEGSVITGDLTEPFSYRRKFRMHKGKKRWISFSDMMRI